MSNTNKPRPRSQFGKVIDTQTKLLVYNVYSYFKRRKTHLPCFADIKVVDEVVEATGLSRSSVKRIISEGNLMKTQGKEIVFQSTQKKQVRKKKIDVDNFDVGVIRRIVNQFYTVKKELPTIKKLNNLFKEQNIIHCSREYLRKLLFKIGFVYTPCPSNKKQLLTESPDIMKLRCQYLRIIKKYRTENKTIYFIDKVYINQSHAAFQYWQPDNDRGTSTNMNEGPQTNEGLKTDKGLKVLIVHAAGREGFVAGALAIFESKAKDSHEDLDALDFEKWIKHQLLPNIPTNSVIIMDNAFYQSSRIEKKPTMGSTKLSMQHWLTQHNIPFQGGAGKNDLLELIDEHKSDQYKIDKLFNESGHTVICLPPYHSDLNPMQIVWADVKGQLALGYIHSKVPDKKVALELLFSNYPVEKWQSYYDHIKNIEDEYSNHDMIFDDAIDAMITSEGSQESREGQENSSDDSSSAESGTEFE